MGRNTCAACGASFELAGGRGRPRLYCFDCLPASDAPDYMVRWRQVNADRVRRYAVRRMSPPTAMTGLRVPLGVIAEQAGVPEEFVEGAVERHGLGTEVRDDVVHLDRAYVTFLRTQWEAR